MIRIRRVAITVGIFLFSIPAFAYASGIVAIVPQSPAGKEACPLGYTAILLLIQNITNDAVYLAGIFAVLLIAYAGFLFVTNAASPDNLQKGRTVLMSTVIGFVIVISAWLIVNEVVVVFTTGNLQSVTALLKPSSKSICLPTVTPTKKTQIKAGSEEANRKELAKAGIGVNNPPCPTGSNGHGCTDVGGVRQMTIKQIITLARAVGVDGPCNVKEGNSCKIVITGGNEPGHAPGKYSHGNGYKVDIRFRSPLDAYIESLFKEPARSNVHGHGGPAYTDSCNVSTYNTRDSNKFVGESTHWDIRITSSCSLKKTTAKVFNAVKETDAFLLRESNIPLSKKYGQNVQQLIDQSLKSMATSNLEAFCISYSQKVPFFSDGVETRGTCTKTMASQALDYLSSHLEPFLRTQITIASGETSTQIHDAEQAVIHGSLGLQVVTNAIKSGSISAEKTTAKVFNAAKEADAFLLKESTIFFSKDSDSSLRQIANRALESEAATDLEAFCLAYGQKIPYFSSGGSVQGVCTQTGATQALGYLSPRMGPFLRTQITIAPGETNAQILAAEQAVIHGSIGLQVVRAAIKSGGISGGL